MKRDGFVCVIRFFISSSNPGDRTYSLLFLKSFQRDPFIFVFIRLHTFDPSVYPLTPTFTGQSHKR